MTFPLQMLVAFSPWQPPAVPAERFEPHVMQQCTEASVRRSLAAVHEPPKPKPRQLALGTVGTVGTVFQAVGAGLLRRDIQSR